MPNRVAIRRYLDVERTPSLDAAIDAIFFEASNTKSFESDEVRAAFRERWLGAYLRDDSRFAYLAMTSAGDVAGYLVGSISDPASAQSPRSGGGDAFRDVSREYPAHLHVNVAPAYRSRGIGGRLIDAFIADARRAGAEGVHVVTGTDSPNVRFYDRNGFREIARGGPARTLVFLARALS
jgi:GNAT superfamily N-acetyltransferase